jgi:hypothetical protein
LRPARHLRHGSSLASAAGPRASGVRMHALTVRFHLPAGTDWRLLRQVVAERAHLYQGLPGLRTKAFVLDEQTGEYGGNYVWDSRPALDAFLASDLFQGAVAKFGEPEVRVHEVAACVEHGAVVPVNGEPGPR